MTTLPDAQQAAKKYKVILADPPWSYRNTGISGSAIAEYDTMTTDGICKLPVAQLADDDAVLILWATWPNLPDAMTLISAWGFEYVTGMPWVKIIGTPQTDLWGDLVFKPQYGIGFWIRGASEPILIAKRGDAKAHDGFMVGLLSENAYHSRKPDNIYQYAEMFPGPYLELFARRQRDGWDVFGNEVANSITLPDR